MKVSIDKNKCIGCGACVSIEPRVFGINPEDGKSEANEEACTQFNCENACREAAKICPTEAIAVE
jgi:ferredoxin